MAEKVFPEFWALVPAVSAEEVRARHEANRSAWNEGAARYTAEIEETIAFLAAGGSNLHPVERANLGDLRSVVRHRDPPPMRVGPGYAVAVERGRAAGGGRGHLRRPYRERPADQRGAGRAGDLVSLRYPGRAARTGRHSRPGLYRPRRARAGCTTWTVGRR